jgi:hypothetical protein
VIHLTRLGYDVARVDNVFGRIFTQPLQALYLRLHRASGGRNALRGIQVFDARGRDGSVQVGRQVLALALLLATALYCSFVYAKGTSHGDHYWKTGDWLIDQAGGLVRRGLLGHLLLRAGLP